MPCDIRPQCAGRTINQFFWEQEGMDKHIKRRNVLRGAGTLGALSFVGTVSADPPTVPPGQDYPGATFQAGAVNRSIAPPDGVGVDAGGYGTCATCPTTEIRDGDDLKARAMVIADADGETAVAMVVVDAQGWFAGYQQGEFGIKSVRDRIATTLGAHGFDIDAGNVVIQSTHSHAAPANIGVWGTNPEYMEYLANRVHETVVEAVDALEPAVIETGVGDIGYISAISLSEGNSYEGWPKDTQLTTLRARAAGTGNDRPGTGRTIGTYATVPSHPHIVHGPSVPELGSDYFGPAARWLESELGGTAVVGPATLGDQVSPMQNERGEFDDGTRRSYRLVDRVGALVGNVTEQAIRDGRLIQDGTVGGAEQHITPPGTNPALLAANCTPAGEAVGIPLDRSCEPPYLYGDAIGTWVTSLRIGDFVVASQPGEAFSHVTSAMRDSFPDATTVAIAGQAQDQLGYFYAPWAFPAAVAYSVNHDIFHVSLALADATITGHAANSTELGLGTATRPADPTGRDPTRIFDPGVQVIVFPNAATESVPESDGISLPVAVFANDAREGGAQAGTPVVDFGDGTVVEWDDTYGRHVFPGPGEYTVTATLPEHDIEWSMTISIDDAWSVTATAEYPVHAPQATDETRAFYEGQTSEPIEPPNDPEALTRLSSSETTF